MYRKVQARIENWIKEDSKHALLVTGARQIGKTYVIREALNNLKCDYIEINFIENPSMTELFSEYTNVKDFELRLSLATNHKLQPGKTIIFFDEVQEVKDIITMSKFLVQDTPYKYVMSGSLLGVEIKDIRSVPVGYMRIIDMYPMDLSEFYRAVGVGADIIKTIENAYINRKPVDEFVHKRLMSIFNIYLIVGGMPEAVKKYIDTNDLRSVAEVQSSIIELYKEDFSKYNKKEKLILNEIYDAIPGELNEKNKRYYINHVEGKVKFDLVKNNFLWLSNAGVAIPVCNVTEAKTPLQMSEKRSLFKLFLSDVGMLTNMFPDETKIKIINDDASINNGAIFENYVAQELKTHGYKVYYYNSKKQGEVDFVIEHDGKVLPIEVKSGKDYKKHSALNNLLENDEYKIGEAIVLSNANVSNENGKIYLPIYMTMFLEEKKMDMVIKPDLTGLNGNVEMIMEELRHLPILVYIFENNKDDFSDRITLLGNSDGKRGKMHDENLPRQIINNFIEMEKAFYNEDINLIDIKYNYEKIEAKCNRRGYDYYDSDEQIGMLYQLGAEQLEEIKEQINMYKKIRKLLGIESV